MKSNLDLQSGVVDFATWPELANVTRPVSELFSHAPQQNNVTFGNTALGQLAFELLL